MPHENGVAAAAGGGLSPGTAGTLSTIGTMFAVAGALQSSIGTYYSVLSRRYELRSEALGLEFQGTMADLNARSAEIEADAILEAGRQEKGLATLRFGQAKAASRTRQAAAGLQAGVGSAAEVQASIEAAKELEALTIERNAFRAAGAARTRAVDLRNRALFARTSAANVRRTARGVSPFLAGFQSIIGGAGTVTESLLRRQERLG